MGHQKSLNPNQDQDHPLAKDTWRRSSAIGVGALGNRHFQGQENEEFLGENPNIIQAVCPKGQVSKI
jgi:hypothetical protein